jgi:hypothetical protein
MKTRITLGILAGIAGIALIWGAAYGVRWVTAEPRGALEAREQIKGQGEFRVAAYDHFFSLCVAVQEDEGTIAALQQELDTKPSAGRVEQINASIAALRANRTRSIRQYNADAQRDYTVGQFRDADLPASLNPNEEETTCAYSS